MGSGVRVGSLFAVRCGRWFSGLFVDLRNVRFVWPTLFGAWSVEHTGSGMSSSEPAAALIACIVCVDLDFSATFVFRGCNILVC